MIQSLSTELRQSLAAGSGTVSGFAWFASSSWISNGLTIRPRRSGESHRRWDALLAGVVEDFAFHRGLAVPSWTTDPSRFLDRWWFVSSIRSMHPTALVETPAAIANRGVFLRRSSLVNL